MVDELQFKPDGVFRSAIPAAFVAILGKVDTAQAGEAAVAQIVFEPAIDTAIFLLRMPFERHDFIAITFQCRAQARLFRFFFLMHENPSDHF